MTCSHLQWLEQALITGGFRETFRGAAWSKNCREWVYFDVTLDLAKLRQSFAIPACVGVHENSDPRSGLEMGLICRTCLDGVIGVPGGTGKRFPS